MIIPLNAVRHQMQCLVMRVNSSMMTCKGHENMQETWGYHGGGYKWLQRVAYFIRRFVILRSILQQFRGKWWCSFVWIQWGMVIRHWGQYHDDSSWNWIWKLRVNKMIKRWLQFTPLWPKMLISIYLGVARRLWQNYDNGSHCNENPSFVHYVDIYNRLISADLMFA